MSRFDRNGERRFVDRRVLADHLRDVQLVEALADDRHADEAAGLFAHEVDRLGGHHLGRHHEVAFVLAVLVVQDDHHLAGANVGDRILDAVEDGLFEFPIAEVRFQLGEGFGQRLDRAKRRRPPPRPQEANRTLRQPGPPGQIGRTQTRPVHRNLQGIRKGTHAKIELRKLTCVKF